METSFRNYNVGPSLENIVGGPTFRNHNVDQLLKITTWNSPFLGMIMCGLSLELMVHGPPFKN